MIYLNKKVAEIKTAFSTKIEDFTKDQYGYYVDLRNQFSKVEYFGYFYFIFRLMRIIFSLIRQCLVIIKFLTV